MDLPVPPRYGGAMLLEKAGFLLAAAWLILHQPATGAAADAFDESTPLALPAVGSHALRIISPQVLELLRVTTKDPDPARVKEWDFVGPNGQPRLPDAAEFTVRADGQACGVARVGFKRRVWYAPLKRRDLRIGNYLYLELERAVAAGQEVVVENPGSRLWPAAQMRFAARMDPMRWSPALHVNQAGYVPGFPKKAMAGHYLGSLGELPLAGADGGAKPATFTIVEARSGREVFAGPLRPRRDQGFTFPTCQQVLEADFSRLRTPGEYRLAAPGLGVSFPFRIDEGVAAAFARTYALGLYHQRCGAANELPFTRFAHGPCHRAPAQVPTLDFKATQRFIQGMSDGAQKDPRHTAPQLRGVDSSLYPFVRQGEVDVSGGHHDAGDYSKYTINSAALIHYLVFSADAFPGVGELDNLGLPESGNGQSDLLEEARWEADFLAKMQDDDGGFYFLVYPRERAYEDNVPPDQGDPQVVWPKNTSATAAAVAALAQISSSPRFRKQFPGPAANYLQKARRGWAFLQAAIARHGRNGAYQKISHYGHEFLHDDELAWAATELFLATGDRAFEREVAGRFDPADRATRRWTWWRLYEGYGCAVRSYAFAAQTGRLKVEQMDARHLAACRKEILAAGQDQLRYARECAYGSSFPDANKRFRNAGWYFSTGQAFDLAVALQLERQDGASVVDTDLFDAILANLNYEGGCNPVNVCHLTGLGWKRQRDIVHQFAQNDRRLLPPSGIPLGNIQAGFQFLHHYQKELGALSFPSDGAQDAPYPFYDRWGDSFNVTTEFVIADQGRGLGALAFLMAQTALKTQPWKPSANLRLTGVPREAAVGQAFTVRADLAGSGLEQATVVWEACGQEPGLGASYQVVSSLPGESWVEAEAQWPDGRRAFAAAHWMVRPPAR
jgi:hypothetical protein